MLKKVKKLFALLTAIVLVIMVIITVILAVMGSNKLIPMIYCDIIVPIFIWTFFFVFDLTVKSKLPDETFKKENQQTEEK